MYNIGTVTTTANSTKLVGMGTKWKENISLIAPQQQLQIQIGTTIYINSIQSIQSNTELTLNFPFPAAAAGSKYVIFNTTFDSISAAANSIVAMNISNVQFSDVLNRIMTETGVITITLPDGTVMQTRTEKERDRLLDAKFDKAGGTVSGLISSTGDITSQGNVIQLTPPNGNMLQLDGSFASAPRINSKPKNGSWRNHALPERTGILMQVADLGFGADVVGNPSLGPSGASDTTALSNFNDATRTAIYKSDDLTQNARFTYSPMLNMTRQGGSNGLGFRSQLQVDSLTGKLASRGASGANWSAWQNPMYPGDYGWGGNGESLTMTETEMNAYLRNQTTPTKVFRNNSATTTMTFQYATVAHFTAGDTFMAISAAHNGASVSVIAGNRGTLYTHSVYTTRNTTKDANGNLKAASPIIKVFSDHIELNDESEGIELEKLSIGRYKLKGTLGMNADASWGGIHGGIVIPEGVNKLPLVWGDFEVLPDGDIIIESRYREHLLPAPLKVKRLETYPEFADLNDYDLCDIPNGHWVDVRVNMPSNSLYNQKQAEAERLAKIEAE